jgi:hypothetical protein
MSDHVPVRQCAGCRERRPKASLRRFVRTGPREWRSDAAKRLPGRGAYLCASPDCLKLAEKNRRYPGLASAAAEDGFQQGSSSVK